MKAYTALYHLAKAIGHYKEVEKRLAALEELGIKLLPIDSANTVHVVRGIEKFGVPLDEGRVKSFEYMGVEVLE